MDETQARRLAEAVYERRKRMRLRQEDLATDGGPSAATVRLIEQGRSPDMQRGTRAGLEAALGWTGGSIDAILQGGAPTLLSETVGGDSQDDGVLMSVSPDAIDGLSPSELQEAIAAATATFLQRAREIRRRLDDEAGNR